MVPNIFDPLGQFTSKKQTFISNVYVQIFGSKGIVVVNSMCLSIHLLVHLSYIHSTIFRVARLTMTNYVSLVPAR